MRLFPHLNVAENIVFGLRARRVPAPERSRRLARAVEILGIGHLLERKPGQLSGGQQQRVALGRAIVAETPVCLMDEPLSNLDAQLRADMRREILALQRRLGITMLYVTHDQTEAMGMADQIVLLRDGHVEQDAPPAEIYARPATSFAASFIGTPPMNLFPLERRGAAWWCGAPTARSWRRLRPANCWAASGRRACGWPSRASPRGSSYAEYLGADTVRRLQGRRRAAAGTASRPCRAWRTGRRCVSPPTSRSTCSTRPPAQRIESIAQSKGDSRRMISTTRRRLLRTAGAALALPAVGHAADAATEISFYFPVAVGGPITRIIDGYAADFQRENPSIKVTPIYAGTYQDTLTKAQTALKAKAGPQLAVLLSTDAFSLIDDDLIVPFDTLATSDADRAWLRSFYPAFLKNGEIDGHTWGVPFQRSTIVLYWNKAAFQDAGLDPERPPATWDEHAAFAQKLTGGTATPWRAGACRSPPAASRIGCSRRSPPRPAARWPMPMAPRPTSPVPRVSRRCATGSILSAKYQAHPPGIVDWGTTPRDFLEQKVAMIWTTTGNLSNIRANAKFPFGVAMLPAGKQRGSPTGGGNFYLFGTATPAQREAGLHFLRWISSPERAAQWGIDTGYVATRPDAWETPAMKAYAAEFPAAAVARDQLQYAVAELSTHDNQRVTQALNDGLQAALLGRKAPDAALTEAQATATRLLRPFHR